MFWVKVERERYCSLPGKTESFVPTLSVYSPPPCSLSMGCETDQTILSRDGSRAYWYLDPFSRECAGEEVMPCRYQTVCN